MEDNSESDDDEFTGRGLVYDSDDEEEVGGRGRHCGHRGHGRHCGDHGRHCGDHGYAVICADQVVQGPSDHLTADKKKVLKFFNEGGELEMTGIQVPWILTFLTFLTIHYFFISISQGCNKKKVSEIIKMRPYEGWVDLVSKLNSCKYGLESFSTSLNIFKFLPEASTRRC